MKGVNTAIVTPFHSDGQVDYKSLTNHVERQVRAEVDGIVVLGTTGETPTLGLDEKSRIIDQVLASKSSSQHICVGVGSNNTKATIKNIKELSRDGIDSFLVVVPYYNKPSQKGLIEHFKAISSESPVPLVLYNVPSRTALEMNLESICELAELDNIVSIKDATGSVASITKLKTLLDGKITFLSGDDFSLFPFLCLGGHGTVSVCSNIAAKVMKELVSSVEQGNLSNARAIHMKLFPLFEALFSEPSPMPLKYMLSKLGFMENHLRLPLVSIEDENEHLNALIKEFEDIFDR